MNMILSILLILVLCITDTMSKNCCQSPKKFHKAGKDICLAYKSPQHCVAQIDNGCEWMCGVQKVEKSFNVAYKFSKAELAKLKATKPTGEPELEFTQDMINAMAQIKTDADYFKNFDILRWDNTGKADIFSFTPEFIRSVEHKSFIDILFKHLQETELHSYEKAEKKTYATLDQKEVALAKSCTVSAKAHEHMIFTSQCQLALAPIPLRHTRRRMLNESIPTQPSLLLNSSRRRLAVDGPATTITPRDQYPVTAAGVFYYHKLARNGMWAPKTASGSLIAVNIAEYITEEMAGAYGEEAQSFDYMLSVGHNFYCHPSERINCYPYDPTDDPTNPFTVGLEDPKRFAQLIQFSLAPGKKDQITYDATDLRSVWIPLYKRVVGDVLHRHPLDFSIVKYIHKEIPARSRPTFYMRAPNYYATPAVADRNKFALVGWYNMGDEYSYSPMGKVTGILPHTINDINGAEPDSPAGHVQHELFVVSPSSYTRPGNSGSPIFTQVMRLGAHRSIAPVQVAIHTGKYVLRDDNGDRVMRGPHGRTQIIYAIHNKLTPAKLRIIQNIMEGGFFARGDIEIEMHRGRVAHADIAYDNEMNKYEKSYYSINDDRYGSLTEKDQTMSLNSNEENIYDILQYFYQFLEGLVIVDLILVGMLSFGLCCLVSLCSLLVFHIMSTSKYFKNTNHICDNDNGLV